jgi:hypothetical protein
MRENYALLSSARSVPDESDSTGLLMDSKSSSGDLVFMKSIALERDGRQRQLADKNDGLPSIEIRRNDRDWGTERR